MIKKAFPEGFDTGITNLEYYSVTILAGLVVPCIPGSHNSNSEAEARYKAQMAVMLARALIEVLEAEEGR